MTKKELLKWVEHQEEKVLNDLDKKRGEALDTCVEKIMEEIGLDDIAAKIQKKFNEIGEMLSKWQAGLEESIVMAPEYYNTTHDKIRCFVNGPIATKQMILLRDVRIKESKAYKVIAKKYDELRENIRHEYRTLYTNVQGLKNAALGMEYLESLGFDLTKLREADAKPVTTALSVPINTDYLFIGGKNENQSA